MAGRHRAGRAAWHLIAAGGRTIDVVDAATHTAHRLTESALAAGRRGRGRYVALCGVEVRPASLTVGEDAYCGRCDASQLSTVGAP